MNFTARATQLSEWKIVTLDLPVLFLLPASSVFLIFFTIFLTALAVILNFWVISKNLVPRVLKLNVWAIVSFLLLTLFENRLVSLT